MTLFRYSWRRDISDGTVVLPRWPCGGLLITAILVNICEKSTFHESVLSPNGSMELRGPHLREVFHGPLEMAGCRYTKSG